VKPLLRFFGKAKAPLKESIPWFIELYFDLLKYEGALPFEEVIQPWRPKAEQATAALEQYKQMNFRTYPYEVKDEDLWRWYALSRVNDYLLMSFQTRPDFHQAPSRQSEDWLSRMRGVGHDRLINQPVNRIEPSDYLQFFNSLGFTSFAEAPYSPFFHDKFDEFTTSITT